MSDTDEIIKELTGALTSNTEALSQLKMQVAKQGDTLAEVKRHSESVKNKVDWDNLGEHVFRGVASSTMGKIEETTGAAKALGRHADVLSIASRDQTQAVKMLEIATEKTAEVRRQAAEAVDALHRALDETSGAMGAKLTHMLLMGALTASVGLFGGYFYAKASLEKIWFSEMGEDLKGPNREKYCGYANGIMRTNDTGNTACFFWEPPKPAE